MRYVSMNDDIDLLEGAVHKLSGSIRTLREAGKPSERQSAAYDVIESAEELGTFIAQILPEIERQAVIDAQMEDSADRKNGAGDEEEEV